MSDTTMISLSQEEAVEVVVELLVVQEAAALSVSVADGALVVVTKKEKKEEMKSSVLKSNLSLPLCSVPHSHHAALLPTDPVPHHGAADNPLLHAGEFLISV